MKNIIEQNVNSYIAKASESAFDTSKSIFSGFIVYALANVFSWLFQSVSIISASALIYAAVLGLIMSLPNTFPRVAIAIFITLIFLVSYEYLKRRHGKKVMVSYFNGTLGENTSAVVKLLVFVAGSVAASYFGTWDVVELLDKKPAYEAPTLLTNQDINSRYDGNIAQLEQEAKDFKETNSYKGKLDKYRGQNHALMLAKVQELKDKKTAALNGVFSENERRVEKAKSEHEASLLVWKESTDQKGSLYGRYVIFTEILFLICLFVMYDYLDDQRLFNGRNVDPKRTPSPTPSINRNLEAESTHQTFLNQTPTYQNPNYRSIGFKRYPPKSETRTEISFSKKEDNSPKNRPKQHHNKPKKGLNENLEISEISNSSKPKEKEVSGSIVDFNSKDKIKLIEQVYDRILTKIRQIKEIENSTFSEKKRSHQLRIENRRLKNLLENYKKRRRKLHLFFDNKITFKIIREKGRKDRLKVITDL